MFSNLPILPALVVIPLIGALFLAFVSRLTRAEGREQTERNAPRTALLVSLIVLLLSIVLVFDFDPSNPGFQFVDEAPWLGGGIDFRMGVDGISVLFILLTAFLTPLCILASETSIKVRKADYMIAFLLLESLMIGVFCSLDLILFYIFFEAVLIPMFIIIGVWGGANRVYASYKFFLYTLLGSVLMLVAILWLYAQSGVQFGNPTTDMRALKGLDIPGGVQTWLWLAFFASFAVKMPMWPVHTWLPDAHVQAPTAGSVVLAAILLKMGGYGFLRFSLPMFPIGSEVLGPLVLWMSAIAIVYTSLVALVQEDMKKLIAYSSVAHMGYVTMGIFSVNQQGIDGAIFQMISHGFISGALFLCVGVIYDRMHTREIDAYGGLVNRMPAYALVFMFFTMANVGLPGTSGFVGEFLTIMGTFQVNTWVAAVAASGVIFSAGYALWLYRRVVMGDLIKESLRTITDMSGRERWIFAPLVVMTLLLGVYPALVLDIIGPSVAALVDSYDTALEAAGAAVQTASE